MFEPLFSLLAKVVADTKSLVGLILLFILFMSGAYLYERYTGYFTLNRLEKSAIVVKQISDLTQSPDTMKVKAALLQQVEEGLALNNRDNFEPSRYKIFLAGLVPWIFYILGTYYSAPAVPSKEKKNERLGLLFIGAVISFVASYLPQIWWPWWHVLFYPVLIVLLLLFVILLFIILLKKRTEAKEA